MDEPIRREYHTWFSPQLGRTMELLRFGHQGLPILVFPTSCGRFYEFEDRGMIATASQRIDAGEVQLICVDSIDAESWYNRQVSPRGRIARHMQYEAYLVNEVVPFARQLGGRSDLGAMGCSFGGYHALNLGLRHPDTFRTVLSMGGAFDLARFFGTYYDQDIYFNLPPHYIPNATDLCFYEQVRRNKYVIATGMWDICRGESTRMAEVLKSKGIPCTFDVWGDNSEHDWPEWHKMLRHYL